jgi:hypothetical protein
LDIEQYWRVVEDTRPKNNDPEIHCKVLTEKLSKLSPKEIIDFEHIFNDLEDEAYRRDLWDVASYINGGCSDDGFTYFRWWLVMQGKDVLELTLSDPESLAEINGANGDELECEDYGYVALHAYEEVTGEDIPDDFNSARGGPGSPPRLRDRRVKTDRGFRRKYRMLWQLANKPPTFDPTWLKWSNRTITHIVQSIIKSKQWDELPVLADALQEAGCSDPFILNHLREGRKHARSCWVTYLLLNPKSKK